MADATTLSELETAAEAALAGPVWLGKTITSAVIPDASSDLYTAPTESIGAPPIGAPPTGSTSDKIAGLLKAPTQPLADAANSLAQAANAGARTSSNALGIAALIAAGVGALYFFGLPKLRR